MGTAAPGPHADSWALDFDAGDSHFVSPAACRLVYCIVFGHTEKYKMSRTACEMKVFKIFS